MYGSLIRYSSSALIGAPDPFVFPFLALAGSDVRLRRAEKPCPGPSTLVSQLAVNQGIAKPNGAYRCDTEVCWDEALGC